MSSVLITGSTGFIGRYITQRFLENGWHVYIAIRASSNLWRFEGFENTQNLHYVRIELGDMENWVNYLDENQVDTVIHLATYGSYPNQQDEQETIDTNIIQSLRFLEACKKSTYVTRFISAGSGSEYSQVNGHSHESSPIFAPNIYGRTKASFGLIGEEYCKNSKVSFVHFRFFTIYGPYEEPSRLIPRLIVFARDGKFPPLSNPNIARDFTYVEDVYDLMDIAVNQKREVLGIFNVSSGHSTSLNDLVNIVSDVFGIPASPNWGSYEMRSFDHPEWSGNNSEVIEKFGWKRKIEMSEGLNLMNEWIEISSLRAFYSIKR
jgi:dolichol-phosphate mannosyltransferase